MYRYKLYGLNILSSRKIKLLDEVSFDRADLTVEWRIGGYEHPNLNTKWERIESDILDFLSDVSVWQMESTEGILTRISFRIGEDRYLNFVLDSKRERLTIYHLENEPENDLDSFFVGPVLGFTLRLREIVCLHSSVVGIDGKAIAFLGKSESGKSTLAAGMADAGAEILADDIAVLCPEGDGFLVQSGYSKVRLRPKAAEFLSDSPESLPIVYSSRESRYFNLETGKNFHSEALPLAAIYVLGEISNKYLDPFITKIPSQERVLDLIKNTSGSYVVAGNLRAAEFRILSRIASSVPVRKLHYAHEITTLPRQCQLILEDFENITKPKHGTVD